MNDLIGAICYSKDPANIDYLLQLLLQIDVIKTQDTAYWLSYLLYRPASRRKTWIWLQKNWSFIERTFSGDMSYETYPRIAANFIKSADEFKEFKDFFADKKSIPALRRAIEMGEAQIEMRLKWIARDRDSVLKILKELL